MVAIAHTTSILPPDSSYSNKSYAQIFQSTQQSENILKLRATELCKRASYPSHYLYQVNDRQWHK